MKKTLIFYAGRVGLCGVVLDIIKAIEYTRHQGMNLLLCPDFSLYGDLTQFIDFGVEVVRGIPPGWAVAPDERFDFAHADWDHGTNHSLETFEKIHAFDVPFERQREIALTFKPKVDIPKIPSPYDVIHIRRGDAFTVLQGCEYHPAADFIAQTTCHDVFVMSDDHRVLDEIKTDKNIHHMIPENETGWYAVPGSITQRDQKIFCIQDQSAKDKNTIRLVQELYIAANSQRFVHTYSNVARFVRLIHTDPEHCIDLQALPRD